MFHSSQPKISWWRKPRAFSPVIAQDGATSRRVLATWTIKVMLRTSDAQLALFYSGRLIQVSVFHEWVHLYCLMLFSLDTLTALFERHFYVLDYTLMRCGRHFNCENQTWYKWYLCTAYVCIKRVYNYMCSLNLHFSSFKLRWRNFEVFGYFFWKHS